MVKHKNSAQHPTQHPAQHSAACPTQPHVRHSASHPARHKTLGLRSAVLLLTAFLTAGTMSFRFFATSAPAAAYPNACVSRACREAYDQAVASEEAAKNAAAYAQTLEGEVARLDSEIVALEAQIVANEAIAADLSAAIIVTESKLTLQQTALAKLLVDMHFEQTPDAIMLLASSSSIGDLAERESRQTTAKSQIAASAEAVRTLKSQLESEKASVDALIASAAATRTEVANRRAYQSSLIIQYQNDSAAYERDAAASREIMQQEIAAEIARYNASGVVGEGYNSYPWAANCPQDNVMYIVVGGYVCQCTSYVGWKAQEFYGIYISSWGNARDWGTSAVRLGYVVDDNPTPHSIAFSTAGVYGHVMWVESINSNGTINLTEYNNYASSKSGLPGDFGARYNVNPSTYRYIHLDQRLW